MCYLYLILYDTKICVKNLNSLNLQRESISLETCSSVKGKVGFLKLCNYSRTLNCGLTFLTIFWSTVKYFSIYVFGTDVLYSNAFYSEQFFMFVRVTQFIWRWFALKKRRKGKRKLSSMANFFLANTALNKQTKGKQLLSKMFVGFVMVFL